ncbi:MAG TPA: hypothetical protein PKJ33_02890 [Alphaproteobacteria bacterium]|nr:hypothetical protein [Alphaproteobacteria bacterium]
MENNKLLIDKKSDGSGINVFQDFSGLPDMNESCSERQKKRDFENFWKKTNYGWSNIKLRFYSCRTKVEFLKLYNEEEQLLDSLKKKFNRDFAEYYKIVHKDKFMHGTENIQKILLTVDTRLAEIPSLKDKMSNTYGCIVYIKSLAARAGLVNSYR